MPRSVVGSDEAEDPLGKLSLAELMDRATPIVADHNKSRLELGHIFFWTKFRAGHGNWQDLYEKTFGGSSLSFRSAQRYIKLWKKAQARAKHDRLSQFTPGTSPESEERAAVTAEVVAEIGNDPPKPEAAYRLALGLSPFRRAATIRLWASPRRRRAEKQVIACLDAILIEAGLLTEDELKREAANQEREKA